MAKTSVEARAIVLSVFQSVTGRRSVSATELQGILAVSRGESGWGEWWKGEMVGSHNWAARQCPNTGKDCSKEAQRGHTCAAYSDTMDGTERTRYPQCFMVYPNEAAGAADAVRQLYFRRGVSSALQTGDALLISQKMRDTNYYGKRVPVRRYAGMIYNNAREIAAGLKEPLKVTLPACRECKAPAGKLCVKGCSGPGPFVIASGGAGGNGRPAGLPSDLVVPGVLGVVGWIALS